MSLGKGTWLSVHMNFRKLLPQTPPNQALVFLCWKMCKLEIRMPAYVAGGCVHSRQRTHCQHVSLQMLRHRNWLYVDSMRKLNCVICLQSHFQSPFFKSCLCVFELKMSAWTSHSMLCCHARRIHPMRRLHRTKPPSSFQPARSYQFRITRCLHHMLAYNRINHKRGIYMLILSRISLRFVACVLAFIHNCALWQWTHIYQWTFPLMTRRSKHMSPLALDHQPCPRKCLMNSHLGRRTCFRRYIISIISWQELRDASTWTSCSAWHRVITWVTQYDISCALLWLKTNGDINHKTLQGYSLIFF